MKPINQSFSHQLLKANRYMTLQSPISFIQKARQSFPSRESTWLSKNPACNLVSWESKTRVNKVSPIPTNARLGENARRKEGRKCPELAAILYWRRDANAHVMRHRGGTQPYAMRNLTHRRHHLRQRRRHPAPAAPALRYVARAYRSSPSRCCWAA